MLPSNGNLFLYVCCSTLIRLASANVYSGISGTPKTTSNDAKSQCYKLYINPHPRSDNFYSILCLFIY